MAKKLENSKGRRIEIMKNMIITGNVASEKWSQNVLVAKMQIEDLYYR